MFSHVTSMLVLIRPAKNVVCQVIGSASEGKYNTVNNTTSGGSDFSKMSEFGDYPIFI